MDAVKESMAGRGLTEKDVMNKDQWRSEGKLLYSGTFLYKYI